MKTLQKFAEMHNLEIVTIKYRNQGLRVTRKGYDLINENREIKLSLEPVSYSNGDKWLVREGHTPHTHLKSVTKSFLESIDLSKPTRTRLKNYWEKY